MALAIFDLDHTLLSGDSDHAWGQFLVDHKIVEPERSQQQNDYFYEQYKAGCLDIEEYLAFALKPLTEHPLDKMLALRETFIEERIKPLITDKSRALIAKHKNAGDQLLIITATNAFVTRPIATLLGFDELIAPEPEIIDGQYTGGITGIPSFQQGKVIRLEMWLAEKEIDLAGAAGSFGNTGELALVGEHVDERRLAHIGAANEGEFWEFCHWASFEVDCTSLVNRFVNLHTHVVANNCHLSEQKFRDCKDLQWLSSCATK